MNMEGTWALEVATPFGTHPATLVLERNVEGGLNGLISSQLGNIPLRNIELGAGVFNAAVVYDFRGRAYEAKVNGQVAGDQLSGTIKVNIPFAPAAKFTGTRAAT